MLHTTVSGNNGQRLYVRVLQTADCGIYAESRSVIDVAFDSVAVRP